MTGEYDSTRDNTGRIDTFSPNTLTPEESELLQKLRHEAAWNHGYPMALITGGTIALLTRKMTLTRRIFLTATGGVIGNIIGKLSFVPKLQQRIITDLPESSPLRQKVEEMRKLGAKGVAGLGLSQMKDIDLSNDHNLEFDTGSEYDSQNMDPEDDAEKSKQKKYTSYEELRKKHRESASPSPQQKSFGILDHGPSTNLDEYPTQSAEFLPAAETEPKIKVRLNKYGDPIVE